MTKRAPKPGEAPLSGKTIAILATDGFEQVELTEPRKALDEVGAKTVVISPAPGKIRGWKFKDWGDSVAVDVALAEANPDDYDALMLPGGVLNPDRLRLDERAVRFVQSFFEHSKPVAAICHAPIMLIEANVIKDRRVTSWPSLKTDLHNAGAHWIDEQVVVDRNLVTSRKPDDIPAFNERMLHGFADGAPSSRQDRSTVEV